ncbi:uncharacterized protein MYCFIDRAFT_80643 [Pseudocercospora fijiensis CIRAD86]|uniref:Uncharacterized protein n=1 Tax=Pseudocercospora fijiensis (strain CIRAD86) TaxID=383855 RepID=M3B111_PSEFD|nr:uncharacterized protein MYCFIDRAFT_80643 [Pseudocercospora fijiensis CIRAD86]EME83083.1 hypothetical protein MYCFIDRAFT_80643 [Pseudocercospora fijiensis CIRAD86]
MIYGNVLPWQKRYLSRTRLETTGLQNGIPTSKMLATVNQFRSTWDHRVLREVTSNDIWNAQWSGRVSQIAALHLPLRTQIRFDDLVHRIRELAQANYPLIFPHEMPTVATIGEYCDALNNEITDVLVGSVDHQWIGWDNDPRTRAKHNRLRSNVAAGFAPYGPDGQSPTEDTKSAAISDRAGRLSFGSNRAALPEQGYWINKDILGKGGWGCASIWLRYDTNGSIVERVVTKESYLQGNWDRPKYWHGPAADRVPMEYTLQKTLSNVPKANNIVNCRAYGLYERYRMYRLYMEYCQHGDLEQSVKEYFGFSQIVDQSVIGENTIYKVAYPSDRPDPITLYKRLEMMSEKFASAKFDEEKDVVIVAPDRYKPFAR